MSSLLWGPPQITNFYNEPCAVVSVSEGVLLYSAEASTLTLIRNIKIIHLVTDGELMPTALLDRHWENLLKKDFSECEDWWNVCV